MAEKQTFTRAQYMAKECSHDDYYAQFVDQDLINFVKRQFGIAKLKKAYAISHTFNDVHDNGIVLAKWDRVAYVVLNNQRIINALRNAGDVNARTLGNAVCILKQAARMAISD